MASWYQGVASWYQGVASWYQGVASWYQGVIKEMYLESLNLIHVV